ncbi:hypothetical protein BGZ60DRAFT_531269 [Tricladium varicosporioides]|nr:hypothetical protein BGZ60DRAFT_531269 [Hymenoscyphus varicosporioides]
MKFSPLLCLLAGALPVFSKPTALKPLVAYDIKYVDVPQKRHIPIDEFAYIEGRSKNLGTFNLAKTFPAKDVLINVAVGKSSGQTSGSLSLTATCISCYTTGSAVVTTEGIKKDESILKDVINFFKNPEETVVNALDLNFEVQLNNLGGHFEFDIAFAASGTYTVTLFKSETPVGVQLDDANKIGLLFTIELTFTVSDSVDFTTGFDLVFPKGASFIINPLNGKLVSMNIAGAQVNSIPVVFKKGAACVNAVLRVKFQAGIGLSVLGKGFDFEAGVFFDPIQYKACITFQPGLPCPLEFTQNFFEEIGAYAKAAVDVDIAKFSGGPTAVTTFLTGKLPSKCLSTSGVKSTSKSTSISITGISKPTGNTKPVDEGTKTVKTVATSLSEGGKTTVKHTQPPNTQYTSHTSHTKASSTSQNGGNVTSAHTSRIGTGVINQPTGTGSHTKHTSSVSRGPFGNSSTLTGPTTTATFATIVTLPTALTSSTGSASVPTKVQTGGELTTSTLLLTSIYTVTSCAPTVTNCPVGKVTSTIVTTTTVCPVSSSVPSTAGGNSGNVVTSAPLTTSTITLTSVSTITSCAATITNCPVGSVTSIIYTTTTICPVSSLSSAPSVTTPPSAATSQNSGAQSSLGGSELTTRTIYSTNVYTITACASLYAVQCPASLASDVVQTKTIVQYTTVCPITQSQFPTTLPPSAVPSFTTTPEVVAVPTISIESPVVMTLIPTPIVLTFEPKFSPNNTAAASTGAYPSMNSTLVLSIQAPTPSVQITASLVLPSSSVPIKAATVPTTASSTSANSGVGTGTPLSITSGAKKVATFGVLGMVGMVVVLAL